MAVDIHRSDHEQPGQPADPEDARRRQGGAAAARAAPGEEIAALRGRRDRPPAAAGRAETRYARWQRKLLDLSLHNRLLNFKPTRRSLDLCCPDPLTLVGKLEAGARITPVSNSRAPNAWEADQRQPGAEGTAADADTRSAATVLKHNEVMVDLEAVDLSARLVELYRTARTDLQEGGANTLFLAVGFLHWKRDDKGERTFRAPLVLVPVALQRESVRSGVRMVLHEDEPRFNTTLLEMLRQDFGLEISGLDESLPCGGRGIDVAGVWNRVRGEIAGVEGFKVVEDVVLGTFSFAKYLMWKDLVHRKEQILSNGVVRRIAAGPCEPLGYAAEFPDPARLDQDYSPESLCTVLPADSSQLSAVAACARQSDFVLIGPPGTGKSQTIANMIAHALAEGRTVLFVSEKVAALDVVYKRLQEAGLGEFCLELHSNKARKIEVLAQLREAWSTRDAPAESEWRGQAQRLAESRRSLNEYVERMHLPYRNDLTPFLALGQVILDLGQPFVELSWESAETHDKSDLQRLRDIARRMDVHAAEAGAAANNALRAVHRADWSPAWQRSLVQVAGGVVESVSRGREMIAGFYGALRINQAKLNLDQLRALKLLAAALSDAHGRNLGFAFEGDVLSTLTQLDHGLELLRKYRALERRLVRRCAESDIDRGDSRRSFRWQEVRSSWWPESETDRVKIRNAMFACGGASGKTDFGGDLNLLWELQDTVEQIAELRSIARKVSVWRGLDTAVAPLEKDLLLVRRLLYAVTTLGAERGSLVAIHSALRELITRENHLLAPRAPVGALCAALGGELENLENLLEEFTALTGTSAYESIREAPGENWLVALRSVAEGLVAKEPRLSAWCAWRRVRDEAVGAGLGPLAVAIEEGWLAPGRISRCFDYSYCRWWVSEVVQLDSVLRDFHSADRNHGIRQFREFDDSFTELSRRHVRALLCARLPGRKESAQGSELRLLRRELEKKSRHKPLRQLIGEIPSALTRLTPCLLMSPLSVAQYLPADQAIFDLVIFDEASQITVWDAVGAVARARNMIVVGDPKQLPPTSFFSRSDEELDGEDGFESDLESILEECLGAGLPARNLEWHYRSEHESLIAFSNHRYYGGSLITFPSPLTDDRAVRCRHVHEGVYGRGGTRTNRVEAKAVVAEVVKRLKEPSFDPSNLSIGVVTFNVEQQRLIEDLLDEERLKDPSIEHFFSDDRFEPLFVKNLENVQGDERDLIFFSVTFGPDAEGHLSMNFGPMNRDGGERRLNVAVTRARSELLVFTSLRSEQIDLARARGAGVSDFKRFLEFAERGPRALAVSIYGPVGEYASAFEAAVARTLSARGWVVHPQIGASAYRVGLGVVHPDSPGRYLAGVECDGETYRRSATARDRDKLREEALRKVGWKIVRVWSLDWWLDPERAADALDGILSDLLQGSREEAEAERVAMLRESLQRLSAEGSEALTSSISHSPQAAETGGQTESRPTFSAASGNPETRSESYEFEVKRSYRTCDPPVTTEAVDQKKFFDPSQDDAIRKMIDVVIDAEAPLREDLLVKRVLRGYGFKRTGRKLRDRVLDLTTSRYETTSDAGGVFFWPEHTAPERWTTFRAPVTEADFRAAAEICFEELAALAQHVLSSASEDPAREMARVMGLSRIDSATRRRLEDVLLQVATRPSADETEKDEARK